ncbi:MAG: protein kinase [Planctomycetota bacterium]|nr:protein kinase [Planctomycetota bacterium]
MNAKEPQSPPKPPFRVHDLVGTAHEDEAIQPATRQAIENLGYRITNPPGKHSSLLGEGGYAAVHYGVRTDGNRPVAIKVFRDDSQPCFASWETERKTMESANFPRDFVPVCLDARHFDGLQPFLIVEYVRGTEINDFVDANKTPLESRVTLLEQLAGGIHRLNHDNNLIHRDISVANTLVDDKGDVRLIDFGLAGEIVKRGNTTIAAHGNPTYSPPEVQQGAKRADVKDKVYNCAMVALHVLTDDVPPENSVRSGDPEHLQRCRNRLREKDIPRALANVVLRGLQDESRRFTTPAAFRDALHDWRVVRPQRRLRRTQLLLLVGCLCSFAAVGWWLYLDLLHAAGLREYAELQRQAEQLNAEYDAVRNLLSEAQSHDQQSHELQRSHDAAAAASRAEATRLYRRAIAVSAGLEQAQPQREALAIPLNEIPWVASDLIARRKAELDARYTAIGNDLTTGNVEQAKSALDSLQRDLAELIADNTHAGQALAAQAALERLQRGVAQRLRKEPGYAPLAQIGVEARAAWDEGQWSDATRLYGLAHDQLSAWLPTQETPEEWLQRTQVNEETVRLVEEDKKKLQSQLAAVETERDKHDTRIRELESQIAQVTKQGADDREQLVKEQTRADDLAAKNRVGSAELKRLQQTVQVQSPQLAELAELQSEHETVTQERDALQRKITPLERQVAVLQAAVETRAGPNVARAAAEIATLQQEIDALDTTEWSDAHRLLVKALAGYEKVAIKKKTALLDFNEDSPTIDRINTELAQHRQLVAAALAARDKTESSLCLQLESQLKTQRDERERLINVESARPASQPVRNVDQTIVQLVARQ